MFILNNPYVSDFFVETIKKNKYKVLDNEISRKYFAPCELTSEEEAKKETTFYSNSEDSIDWIINSMPKAELACMIKISKDKSLFRKMLRKIYPNYFYREINLDEIKSLDFESLKYPLVLKPSIGFLSFGVYPVKNSQAFREVSLKLESDIEKFKNVFPKSVVDTSSFIIEEMIEGDEFALDAYFDEEGKPVILNIFHHPFYDENDVSDRIYYTSKKIVQKYLKPFESLLLKIGEAGNYKNFPFHLELRAKDDNIIPIELNPMRFCGWCITDIAKNAWGINVYEYFEEKKAPNWDDILKTAKDGLFYFTIGDVPSSINREEIVEINYDKYLENISNPLVVRKIDYKTKPVFAIVFGLCEDESEIKNILGLDMRDFIKTEKR